MDIPPETRGLRTGDASSRTQELCPASCDSVAFDVNNVSLPCLTPLSPRLTFLLLGTDNQEFPLRYAANLESAGHQNKAHQEFNRVIKAFNHVWFFAEGGLAVPKIPRPGAAADGEYGATPFPAHLILVANYAF